MVKLNQEKSILIIFVFFYNCDLLMKNDHFETNNVDKEGRYKTMINAFYYSITTLTTSGLGEIYPITSLTVT